MTHLVWLPWLSRHLVTIVMFVLTLVFVSGLLRERRSPGSAVAWLLTIVLIPYVGIPLYLFLGSRKLKRRSRGKRTLYAPLDFDQTPSDVSTVERLLLASGAPPRRDGNHVELVEDGMAAYEQLLALIDGARREISIATFILGHDAVADRIIEHLAARARTGVRVRFLLDGVGALMTHPGSLGRLREAGARVTSFMPPFRHPFRGHSNLRNHRKIVIVDGEQAVVGGMNLAREYMGPQAPWVDLAVRLRGPVVADLDGIFEADWLFAQGGRQSASAPALRPPPPTDPGPHAAGSLAQVVPNGPDVANDTLYDGLLSAIFEARHRIWIVTPYFIPDETLTRALELACRRGVDVRILVPRHSNHRLADLGRGSYLRQVQEEGARILLHPRMVHAKATLIDERCAIVGSANADMRSFFFNFEVCVFLYSRTDIERIAGWMQRLARDCAEGYPAAHLGGQTLEGICRILSPLL
jgi:cardiolipin synthase